MSLPPAPGPASPPRPPAKDDSVGIAAAVVMAALGVLALMVGLGILLCGGLGWVMTGGLDTGAGAMMLAGILVIVVGVAMLAVPLFVWRNR
ncbi:hypothetical protein [Janibacter limosus]|uniref:Major facilitator superfamily (MFS) profile domain-containing protein n=1 Tax=Janibacter limosus TaxID=53458 RepID=A0A4P6MWR4_9MICO|nr:hypothetical protein [Janibacter limosus]QBF47479.1 hypothetical protein EXU32_15205 [Janibacter limosus]